MQMLTFRGLSPFYGPDLVFYTNMYDLFPNEINQIFTGMIADQPGEYMPRIRCGAGSAFPRCVDPTLVCMDFYRGDCTDPATCRPHPADVTYSSDFVVNGGDNFLLQSYAAIYGLSEFPVYYDTTFQTQLFLCVEGQGDCFAAEGVEGVDYVRYTSNRFGKSFLGDACLQALADPGFAWPRAEQRNEMLPLEMACALLMAGDYEAHERICRQVFASEPDTFGREHAEVRVKMWLVRPRDRSPDLTRQALDFAHSIPESTNTWECLTRGIAAYRQGDYAKAGDCLNQARRSQDIGCQGAATLYLAMSEQQMGRPAEAARLLHEAEALLRDPLLTFTGSAWYDLCVCALAREEARQLLGQTNPLPPSLPALGDSHPAPLARYGV